MEDNNRGNLAKIESNPGILSRLQSLNSFKTNRECNVCLYKISSDEQIKNFTDSFFGHEYNLGLRISTKLIPHEYEESVYKINLYDFNYIQAKKFKYLKKQSVRCCENVLFLINIYDKRTIENLKLSLEDITQELLDNTNKNGSNRSYSNYFGDKKFIFLMLKTTNNFLEKLTEKQTISSIKASILTILSNSKFLEVSEEHLNDINGIVKEIIKLI